LSVIDLDAVSQRHDEAILVSRKTLEDPLISTADLAKLFACCSDIPELLTEMSRLQMVVKEIEKPGALLCACGTYDDSPPTNAKTNAPLDHHCECPAVLASAAVLGAYRLTKHAQECTCSDIYD
jgi:hypothetical protein